MNALMLGNFDETVSVKDFLHHADTGIGTCAGLDGEAVFEDGVAYKATADGKVVVMKPEDGVAFGTVAKFDESVPAVELRGIADIEAMKKALAPYVEGNQIQRFDLTLPRNLEFAQRDLCEDLSAKTAAVEGVKK